MSINLHTTKTYKIEYGPLAVCGWDEIQKFLDYLHEKRRKNPDSGIYINEEETEIEIPFNELDKMRKSKKWGKVARCIWNNSDHENAEAHLSVW